MALLRERRSVRGWSTSTPDTLMADKANAGQAGSAVAAAGEGLKRGWWRAFAVFPPLPFDLQAGSARGFKGGDRLVDGVTPDLAVCSYT